MKIGMLEGFGKLEDWNFGRSCPSGVSLLLTLRYWIDGMLEKWMDGRLEKWRIGMMEGWRNGILDPPSERGLAFADPAILDRCDVGKMEDWNFGILETPVRARARFCRPCDIWIGEIIPKKQLNRIFQTLYCRNRRFFT
jgi:hypothetical protein